MGTTDSSEELTDEAIIGSCGLDSRTPCVISLELMRRDEGDLQKENYGESKSPGPCTRLIIMLLMKRAALRVKYIN